MSNIDQTQARPGRIVPAVRSSREVIETDATDIYLFVHIAAAALWIGAAFLQALLGLRIAAEGDAERQLGLARDSEWLGVRLFLPASIATLVFGVALVLDGPWGFSELWIVLGLAAIVLSTAIGMAILGPGWARVARAGEEAGATQAEVGGRIARLLVFGWVDFGLLLAAVWVMAVKPSGDDVAALVVAVAIPAAAALIGISLRRTP